MDTAISTIIAFIVGGLLGTICTWFKKQHSMMSDIKDLVCANAQDRIVWLSEQYIQRGYITVREKAMLKNMYKPYKKLGWNSFAKEAMEEVEKLQVKKGEKHE